MIVDEWRGQGVYRSDDMLRWERNTMILDKPGDRPDDGAIGHHADVVVQGEEAYVFYFTHPGRAESSGGSHSGFEHRRSSIQVARLDVVDGVLVCDRNADFDMDLRPPEEA